MGGTLGAYRDLLGNRALTRLLAGEFVSSVGDWLYLVALLVVVDDQTGDPVLLGLVGALRVLPYVVLSIPAGIVADRWDRKRILITTDLLRGALMLVLAAVVATGAHWAAIVALSTLATCFSAFFGPTIGAYLPTLVRDERELGPANSAWSTLDNLAFILGPALAFVMIAAFDLTWAFLLNAISFAICAAILVGLPGGRPQSTPRPVETDVDEGMEATGQAVADATRVGLQRRLAGLLVIDTVGAFVFGGIGILTVILAQDTYGAGTEATGLLNAAIGVGGLAGAILAGFLVVRRRLAPPLLGGAIALGVGVATLGLVGGLAAGLVAMTILAAGDLILEVVTTTIFQRIVPDEIRGRALGIVETIETIAYAAGAFALPIMVGALGSGPVLLASGVAIVVCGVLAVILLGTAATVAPEAPPIAVARVRALPLFTGMPAARLDEILARLRPREVTAGEVLIRQGEPADRFYIIDSGAYEVSQVGAGGQETRLRVMGPDEVFGEIGLLTGRPRTATVTAQEPGRLLELGARDFAELVAAGPGLGNRLLDLHRGAAASWIDEAAAAPVSAG